MPKPLLSLLACLALAGGLIGGWRPPRRPTTSVTACSAVAGEVCFAWDIPSTTHQKHFWYSGDHNSYYFTNVNTGNHEASGPVLR